jgi:hypothetical protein
MQSRTVKPRRVGDRLVRYALRITDDPSAPNTHESAARLRQLLQDLVEQPALLMCGPATPSHLRVHHNGTAWVLDAEADVYTESPDDLPPQS